MSRRPFRFLHAADFHLELPPLGVTEVPEHLHDVFLECPYQAAERVFQTALAEQVEFLVLAGDLLDPLETGPRGPLFLQQWFRRLGEAEIAVYWAGGRVDPPEAWPACVGLPENVHVFPAGRPQAVVHQRESAPLARLVGASSPGEAGIRPEEFEGDPAGLFSIAVVHAAPEPEAIAGRPIQYWALGRRHNRWTWSAGAQAAHDPGSPQGRHPEETGPHGCTLVHVDDEGQVRTSLVSTSVLRWESERLLVDEGTTPCDLETRLRQRMEALKESAGGADLLVSWTVAGHGPLVSRLRRGGAVEILAGLRREFGVGPPVAWSVALAVEPAAVLPPEWYEQDSIRGEFLRTVRHYQINPAEPLGLDAYLPPGHSAALAGAAAPDDGSLRERVLHEAALLGADLLSGEEAQP